MKSAPPLITDHLDVWTSAVKTKSSAGRGGGKKEEPYGIKKLRDLILELAVRGLLVPQDPNDEPAAELLKNIARENARSTKEVGLTRGKHLPSISEEDLPYKVVEGWSWVLLGSISIIERGGSPRPIKAYLTDSDNGLNWIKIGDTDQGGKYIRSTEEKIRPDGLNKTRMVYPGDFLLTNSMSFGRPYITLIEGCIHDGWLRISPPASLDKDFLYYVLSSPIVYRFFKLSAAGAVVQNLNSEKVRLLPIPLPPLAEQHRIADKVDELMALCDQLELQRETSRDAHDTLVQTLLNALTIAGERGEFAEAWRRIESNFNTLFTTESSIDQLKQTILQLAVMGKLVKQDPDDERATLLLSRFDSDPPKSVLTRVAVNEKDGDSFEREYSSLLPPGWEWASFGRLLARASVGIDRGRALQGLDKSTGYLKMNNIKNSGGIDLSDLTRIDVTEDELKIFSLCDGDFLFNTRNSRELVGKTCVFRTRSNDKIVFNNNILRVKLVEGMSPEFLDFWFRSPQGRKLLEKLKSNTTNVCAIYQGKLMSFPCVVPPIAEQHRIVAKVDELMTLCDRLKESLKTARSLQVDLADALVEIAIQ